MRFAKRGQQIRGKKRRQRAREAEQAELRIGHPLGIDIDLHAKPHELDLLKYPGEQGVQEMRALMDQIIPDNSGQNAEILPCSF